MQVEERPLFAHQVRAVEFLRSNDFCGMLAHEPGLGKTRTALEAFREARVGIPELKLLVVAPLSLIEAAWHKDLLEFAPELDFHNAHRDGLGLINEDVVAVNYEFFQRERNVAHLLKMMRSHEWMAVLDESSKIKNHASLTTKAILQIKNAFRHRIVMSGTPAPNCEMEYFTQMEFVRPGILGKTFSKFRGEYFHLEQRGKLVQTQGMIMTRQAMQDLFRKGAEYRITELKSKRLFDTIGPLIHSAKMDDCLDIPEQTEEVRTVAMGPKQKAAYRQMSQDLVMEFGGVDIAAMVAISKVMKLREVTSGFAMYEEPGVNQRTGEACMVQKVVELGESPKMDELEDLLDQLGEKQVIIWCQFKWEIEKVCAMLLKRAERLPEAFRCKNWATLYSDTSDREDSINNFISGKYRYLVANPHSAAHGLTFVNCQQQVFFSLDYSWESFFQAKRRTRRAGQKEKTVCHFLIAAGTIDEEILDVLRGKGTVQDMVHKMTRRA